MKRVMLVSAVLSALAGGAALLVAGPLNPPAGAVSSTYKTLSEVEPRIAINATNTPGDTSNVFRITQPGSYYLTGNVTGVTGKNGIFVSANNVTIDLNGFSLVGVAGTLDGISATAVQNITILNGNITGWILDGIRLTSGTNVRIQGVASSGNTGDGVLLSGRCVVKDCIFSQNAGNGLFVNAEAVIENCIARGNTLDGIVIGALGVVSRCESRGNLANGIRSNANGYSSIVDCVVAENRSDGISVFNSALVARNNCAVNGSGGTGAGIHVTGADCRVESNVCVLNDFGIQVDFAGNIIVKNTCSGNASNWSAVAGNVILVVNATTAGAVSGNSGGAAPGSTDPNANFSY